MFKQDVSVTEIAQVVVVWFDLLWFDSLWSGDAMLPLLSSLHTMACRLFCTINLTNGTLILISPVGIYFKIWIEIQPLVAG